MNDLDHHVNYHTGMIRGIALNFNAACGYMYYCVILWTALT